MRIFHLKAQSCIIDGKNLIIIKQKENLTLHLGESAKRSLPTSTIPTAKN